MKFIKTKIIEASNPSTFKMTDNQWDKTCKKDGLTGEEIMEAVRRNGVESWWPDEIYVTSSVINKVKKVKKTKRTKSETKIR
jgi:hypothetical protein